MPIYVQSNWKLFSIQYNFRLALSVVLGGLFAFSAASEAASLTWGTGGAGGTGNWATTSIWDGSTWAPNDLAVFPATAGTVTISSGVTETADGLTFNVAGYIIGGAGTLSLASPATVSISSGTTTIDSILAGTSGLTLSGSGILALSASNTYSGTTTISSGTLQILLVSNVTVGNPNFSTPTQSAGGYTYNPSGATWTFSVQTTTNGGAGIATNGSPWYVPNAPSPAIQAAFIQSNGAYISQSISIPVTSTYQVSWQSVGRGTTFGPKQLELLIDGTVIGSAFTPSQSAWTAYTSPSVSLAAGSHTVEFMGTAVGSGDLSSCVTLVTITNLQSGILPNGASAGNVAVNGTLDLNTASQTINGLSGTGTVDTVAGGHPTLTVGNNNASGTFSGVIKNTSGTLALTQIGTGTLTLSGVNTYAGATTVSAGTLALGAGGSIGASAVTVASGATLSNATTTARSVGAATTLNSGGLASFTGSGGASSAIGKISVTGNLTLNANAVTVGVTGSALAAGDYPLMSCTGTLSGSVNATPTITGTALASGYTDALTTTTGSAGHFDLIVKSTPTFSGLTASPSITYGATSVTLSGTVSSTTGPATVYAASGDTVTATINGHAVNGTVSGSSGAFTITYNSSSLPTDSVSGSPYTITYAYAGNSTVYLNAAANNTSTSLTVHKATPTISPAPTASVITDGQALSASTLSGGAAVNPVSAVTVTGSFAFTTPSTIPGVGTSSQGVTFTPTDTTDYNTAATTISVTVVPGPVDHFVLSAIASPQTAGTPFTITTITAQDANNNTATNFSGTVAFGGTAGVTGTSGAFTLGVLNNASVTPTVAGASQSVTATSGGKTGTSGAFTVNPGALDHFAISAISTQTAGTAFTIATITAQDINNNTVTNFGGTVTYGGTAGVTGTSAAFALGVLTNASVTPTVAGAGETVTVTSGSQTGTSAAFTVNPGALNHFALSGLPYEATSGSPFTLTITAQDVNNNTATNFAGTITYGGTMGVVGASAAFTAGVLNNASVMPVAAGDETLTVSDGAGHTGSTSFFVLVSQNLYTSYGEYELIDFPTSYVYVNENSINEIADDLNYPDGMAFDYAGNLYVAGDSGHIYKFTPGGAQSTFASGLDYPQGLAFDSAGNLYVADSESGHVYEYTPGGVRSTFASGLAYPIGLAFNSAGALFVGDGGYEQIFKFTISGGVTNKSVFVSGVTPSQIAFNRAGDLFEADDGSSYVYGFSPSGAQIFSVPIRDGNGEPQGVAFNSAGAMFVADAYYDDEVYCFTPNGTQSAYAFLDYGYGPGWLAFQPPLFTGLTASQSVPYGASAITLAGNLSYGPNQLYPTNGETITVTINGNAQTTTINDATGDFSFSYNLGALPVSATPYLIIYSYAGDSLLIAGNNPSTTLTVNPITATITTLPTASAIINGQALSNSVLSGGVANSPGTFAFTTPSTVPGVGTALQGVIFTPTSGNYTSVTTNVSVTVNPYGPLDHFAISSIAPTQASGIPFTITITAQDAYNNTVANFNGTVTFGGTAGVSATSAPFINGVLTITVTPATVGSNLTLTVSDGAGHTASTTIGTVNLAQNLFESDQGDNIINEFTTNGVPVAFASGLDNPTGLAFDSAGNLYESDSYSGNIYKFTTNGVKSTFASGLSDPLGLAFNSAGVLFEVDSGNSAINKFTTNGVKSTFAAFTPGSFYPQELAFNSAGNLFVSDIYPGSIYEFTTNGASSLFASGLSAPVGLAFNSAGDLFVADVNDGHIYEFTPGGVRSTFASGLFNPQGLAFNSAGVLFETGADIGTIYEFTTNGVQSAFASGVDNPFSLAFQPPIFSGLTSQTITNGTSAITLAGTLSYASGQIYPAQGETVTVTINGNPLTTTINDSTGDFSLTYNTGALPASATPYLIIYSYSGDTTLLAANNPSTTLTVNQITTTIITAPTAATITYGQTLGAAALGGGVASVPGTFAFTTPSTIPVVGTASQSVTFTPANPVDYTTVITNISVTVNQATPDITTAPTAAPIIFSQALGVSALSGAVVVNPFSGAPVAGTFAFNTPSLIPGAGTASQNVTFTPTDATDYSAVPITVSVTVKPFGPLQYLAMSPISSPQTSGVPINMTISAQDAYTNIVTSFTGPVTFGGTAGVAGPSGLFTAGVLNNASVIPLVVGSNLTLTVSDGAGHTNSATIGAVNLAQNLFESDYGSNIIYEFATNGVPDAIATGLAGPNGLAFNSAGVLFQSDSYTGRIYEYTTSGVKSTFASGVSFPIGLAFNSAGVLFEADLGTGSINKFTPNGVRSTFASGLYPTGLAFNSAGVLFEADESSGNIYEFTANGVRSTFASGLSSPTALAFNSAGVLFVGSMGTYQIYAYTTNGARTTFATGLNGPYGLAFNSAGVLFEADEYSGHIYEFTPNGVKSTFATGLDSPVCLAFQPPLFSDLTASQSITYGASAVTLGGTLSYSTPNGTLYPAQGETITVTIGGNAQTTTINDATGDFSFSYNSATIPASATPYPIIYSYAGDPALMPANNATTSLTVNQITTTITTPPTAAAITYGQTLGASVLSGGAASVLGTFAFTTPSTIAGVGTASQSVTFTPTSGDYTTATTTVSVTVNQATPSISSPPATGAIAFGQALSASSFSGGTVVNPYSGASVSGIFTFTVPSTVPGIGTAAQGVIFTPTDTVDYTTNTGTANVTVNKATPSIATPPTASVITYGQTLSNSVLSGGSAVNPYSEDSVLGTFAFTTPSTKPNAGTASRNVTFTPSDTNDYNNATLTVSVTVNPAPTTITTPPTASAINYGQSLGASALSGGSASVPGNFGFTTPSLTPNVGTASQSVTFTPNSGNYATSTTSVNVTVNPAPLTITANSQVTPFGTAITLVGSTSFTANNLQNGDTIGSVTLTVSGPYAGSSNEPIGTYIITPSAATGGTFGATNYIITYSPGTLRVNPSVLNPLLTVGNPNFSTPNQGGGGFNYYTPPNTATVPGLDWTFNSAGIAANGSPWYGPNAPAPATQAGYIQITGGYISQNISFPSVGTYQVSWSAVGRGGGFGPKELEFMIDGTVIGSPFTPSPDAWTNYTSPAVPLAAGDHTLEFLATATGGSADLSSCITLVSIQSASPISNPATNNMLNALHDFEPFSTGGVNPYSGLVLSGNILYGTASGGGSAGAGTVFAVHTDGTGLTNLYSFMGGSDGSLPYAGLVLSGNTLYGTTLYGGTSGAGTVFAINTDGTGYTNLYSFTGGNDGAYPAAGLIISGNTLYGTAQDGGSSGYGTVFAISTNGMGFTNLHGFTGNDGANPYAGLVLSGNTLYGTASGGGSSGYGTVFAVNTNGMCFTNLYGFTGGNDGAYPVAGLTLSGNILFGTAQGGGSSGYGTVFAVNTNGMCFTNLYGFTGGNDGAYPNAGLTLSGNTLYGAAQDGGGLGYGAVFAVNTDGTMFTNLHTFTGGSDGANPQSGLVLSGNILYGTALYGGSRGVGTVYAVSIDGTVFTVPSSFPQTIYSGDGDDPVAGLILSGNTLFGTTRNGGSTGSGAVFSINSDGTGLAIVYNFTNGYDGAAPVTGLILCGDTLYGTASYGGSSGYGTVYAVHTNGMCFTNLHGFTGGTDGAYPVGGLILSGNTLYGTAENAGSSGVGTVFSIHTDGTAFTVLYTFTNGSDGAIPVAGLILSGNTLFGTAEYGGSSGAGTVFSVTTEGTAFTTLYSFTGGGDGANPVAGLVLSGCALYGTAESGGYQGAGTVFSVNTNTLAFSTLYDFTGGSDGANPAAGLILSGNILYGTAENGGSSGDGTVFAVNTSDTSFATMYSFDGGSDGANPVAGLTLCGHTLYGTASQGGNLGNGAVFALTIATPGTAPSLVWNNPAPITYGTPLTGIQLNAQAAIPGHFVYTPPMGTMLPVGNQTLSVTFKPNDFLDYSPVTQTASINVTPAPLTITASAQNKTYGTVLSLGSTAFGVSGLAGSETVTAVTLTANGGTAATDPVSGSPYTITPSAATGTNGFLANNYNITYNTGTLTVTPLPVVLTGTRPYDGTTTVLASILTISNDIDGANLTLSGSATLAGIVGAQPITGFAGLALNGAAAPNYTLTGASGSVLIPNPLQINPVPNQFIAAGQRLLITNYAQDSAPPIKFCLGSGAPSGAFIDSTNGVFCWTPSCEEGTTTNVITIWATDSGTPPLSNSMSFLVMVGDCLEVGIGSTVMQVGQNSTIPVTLFSSVGITNLIFTLVDPCNPFTNWTIASSNASVGNATTQTAGSPPPLFTWVAQAGQTLQSPSPLGILAFTALPGNSAFVPLTAINITGTKADGSGVETTMSQPGQVVLIGLQPLLGGGLIGDPTRTLTFYGNPGTNYLVTYCTNLASPNWQAAGSVLLTTTNLQQNFNVNQTAPQIYYRAQVTLGQ